MELQLHSHSIRWPLWRRWWWLWWWLKKNRTLWGAGRCKKDNTTFSLYLPRTHMLLQCRDFCCIKLNFFLKYGKHRWGRDLCIVQRRVDENDSPLHWPCLLFVRQGSNLRPHAKNINLHASQLSGGSKQTGASYQFSVFSFLFWVFSFQFFNFFCTNIGVIIPP